MKAFEYYEAKTVAEALEALARHGPGARPIAGGTDLLVQMEESGRQVDALVDLSRIPGMREIVASDGRIAIGAAATLRQLEKSDAVLADARALQQAAAIVGSVQIRNLATLAGNICNASPSADTSPALLVLGAKLVIVGGGGERTVDIEDFFRGPGETLIAAGEFLRRIEVPRQTGRSSSAYRRLTPRKAMDIAIVGVAGAVALEDDGETLAAARISLGAVAPTPIRAPEAEALLAGKRLDETALRAAGEAAAAASRPIDDLRASAAYRRQMVDVLTRRTLTEAYEAARK